MCGIAGLVNWGSIKDLERMVRIQRHRGPDDEGVWHTSLPNSGWVGLGSSRLAILDLSQAGHMPMTNEDGTVWITYNGEVYNWRELRHELLLKGHRFRSRTDTEVILHLYEEEGVDCVRRLNGMFAFGIWDMRLQHLFLARDPFGIKPLYYVTWDGSLAFASELKALLQLPHVPRDIDIAALDQYLTFLWVPEPKTMLRYVYKLPAGYYALWCNGELRTAQYWDLTFPSASYQYTVSPDDLIQEVRLRFRRAVESQLLSDVPIGAFLSSGLDSTSIVATMREVSRGPVSTYTITFPPGYRRGEITLDDPGLARRVAGTLGCRHTEIVVEPDVVSILPKVIWHLDEPIADPAAVMAYLVCREARATSTVLLSGIGGDEVFAGYRKYIAHDVARRYRQIPSPLRRYLIEPLVLGFPSLRSTRLKGYVRLAKKMALSGSLPQEDRFLMDSTYFTQRQKSRLYTPDLASHLAGMDSWHTHRGYFSHVAHADFLHQMQYLDMKTFMVSLNLTYNDRMSMASSVEVRVPFLDKDLVQFVAWEVPPSLKLRGHTTKYILRKAMEGVLPAEVLRARKAGFGAPVDYWLARDLRQMVDDLLSESAVLQRGYFDPAFVRKLVTQQRLGLQDWSLHLWALLTLELWMRTFLDRTC